IPVNGTKQRTAIVANESVKRGDAAARHERSVPSRLPPQAKRVAGGPPRRSYTRRGGRPPPAPTATAAGGGPLRAGREWARPPERGRRPHPRPAAGSAGGPPPPATKPGLARVSHQ